MGAVQYGRLLLAHQGKPESRGGVPATGAALLGTVSGATRWPTRRTFGVRAKMIYVTGDYAVMVMLQVDNTRFSNRCLK